MALIRAQLLSAVLVLLSIAVSAAPLKDLFEQLRELGIELHDYLGLRVPVSQK